MKTAWLALKYFLTFLLTLGVVISIGVLSLAGLWHLIPSLIPAITTFFLSGTIDAEVYKQNILKGLTNVKLMGKEGFHKLIIKSLENRFKEKKEAGEVINSQFLDAYYAQKKYVASFKHRKLTEEQQKERKDAKRRLRAMQKFFVEQVFQSAADAAAKSNPAVGSISPPEDVPAGSSPVAESPSPESYYAKDTEFAKLVKDIAKEDLPGISRKIWLLRLSWPLNILGGAGSGFATASAMKTALVMLSIKFGLVLTATALSAFIWPLVIIAAIGYAWIIYKTVADILCNETVNKWRKKLVHWFLPRKDKDGVRTESIPKHVLRVVAIGFLLALALSLAGLATVATAGTWWYAVKKGAVLLPYLAGIANYIRDVLTVAVGITVLLFSGNNSLVTVKKLVKLVKEIKLPNPVKRLREAWKALRAKENWLQIINPFRILAEIIFIPYKIVVFVGHLGAVGITTDASLGKLNGLASAAVSSGAEFFTDAPYIFKGDGHENNIPIVVLKVVLSPLLFLSAVWNCLASQFNKDPKPGLNFGAALKQSFGVKEDKPYEVNTENAELAKDAKSTTWLKAELSRRFAKEEQRLQEVINASRHDEKKVRAERKKEIIFTLKNYMLDRLELCASNESEVSAGVVKEQSKTIEEFLAAHKIGEISYSKFLESKQAFFPGKTTKMHKTQQFVQKMAERYTHDFVVRP